MRGSNSIIRFLQLTILAGLLSACDGGIFGTGDGQRLLVENADSMIGGEGENIVDGGDDLTPSAMPDMTDSPAVIPNFTNLQVATSTAAPLINIINVSDKAIRARLNTSSASLFPTAIEAGDFSQTAELQLGENTITLINPVTSAELLPAFTFNVGASSLTTLIVRDSAIETINAVLLSTLSMSATPSMAQLRIVQANLLSDEDTASTLLLQPNGSSPGGGEVSFSNISVATAGTAVYQAVGPGDYQLIDSLARIESQSLSLQAGKVYTLVIIGRSNMTIDEVQEPVILLHEDDLLVR
jgi:hypothetical protein